MEFREYNIKCGHYFLMELWLFKLVQIDVGSPNKYSFSISTTLWFQILQ